MVKMHPRSHISAETVLCLAIILLLRVICIFNRFAGDARAFSIQIDILRAFPLGSVAYWQLRFGASWLYLHIEQKHPITAQQNVSFKLWKLWNFVFGNVNKVHLQRMEGAFTGGIQFNKLVVTTCKYCCMAQGIYHNSYKLGIIMIARNPVENFYIDLIFYSTALWHTN